jgi:hypothetical protein
MPRLVLPAAITICAALVNACDDAATPVAPASVSQAGSSDEERLVIMMDGCDPESFEAADVTCVRPGGVTFERFVYLLGKHLTVGAWHISPRTLNANVGQVLLAVNQGGEVHTFTEVEDLGGGIIPVLNMLSGNPVPAPECVDLAPGDFVAPGASRSDELEVPGTAHYQCCIHPWMRLDLDARP